MVPDEHREPDVENPILEEKAAKADAHIGKARNSVIRTVVDENEAARDFYNRYNRFEVKESDREEYQRYRDGLSEEEAAMLDAGYHFYGVSFENQGGLVMPLVLRFTLEDGTEEVRRIAAEVWLKNEVASQSGSTSHSLWCRLHWIRSWKWRIPIVAITIGQQWQSQASLTCTHAAQQADGNAMVAAILCAKQELQATNKLPIQDREPSHWGGFFIAKSLFNKVLSFEGYLSL